MEDFEKLFKNFNSLRVVVAGDIMLDTYMWGTVERISPEAPVPVVSLNKKEFRIGGAGNVALNCVSLGAQVSLLSVTGDDADAIQLKELVEANGIGTEYVLRSERRITTNKTRIISRNQQMMRLDAEVTADLSEEDEKLFVEKAEELFDRQKPDIVIFEDYNKGVLTESIIGHLISLCGQKNILTAVDPKRKNFFAYKHADIFKPNLKEVKEALNLITTDTTQQGLGWIHEELTALLQHKVSLITLSEKGVFCQEGKDGFIIPSHYRNITDVSGAGDTVIAVASLVYAATKNTKLTAEIANIAGGLVCEDVGTVAISKDRLLKECELLLNK
ncbi:MAG TPA: bifunctional ADP-heptose synthase [Chitinophagaceae bacterium]|nr:bifunctional ADP-heptose synthase [Chitinophagaceae bacterium]